mgnify:FL=1
MSKEIIIPTLRTFPGSEMFSFENRYNYELRQRKHQAHNQAFGRFKQKLVGSQTPCELEDVKNLLLGGGVPVHKLEHHKNTIIDCLKIQCDGDYIEITRSLFPKGKSGNIKIVGRDQNIYCTISDRATPESIAEFLLSLLDWIPEYMLIDEKLKAEMKQEEMALQIAFDLLDRVVCPMLDQKGYDYDLDTMVNRNKASLRIKISAALMITLEVDLLQEFLDQVVKYVESLPIFSAQ